MVQMVIGRIKDPVSWLREKASREPVRRDTIYGIITLFAIVLLNIGTIVRSSMNIYSKECEGYEKCTRKQLWGFRWNAIRECNK